MFAFTLPALSATLLFLHLLFIKGFLVLFIIAPFNNSTKCFTYDMKRLKKAKIKPPKYNQIGF